MLRAIGIFAVSSLLAGCTDTSSLLTTTPVPTLLTVDPLAFRGPVRCGAPELQSYVVALTDISSPSTFAAVSLPVSCANLTSFGQPPLVVGAFYTGEIDGYDHPPCDSARQIFPPGCVEQVAPNKREVVDHTTQMAVPARWHWQCGELPPDFDAGAAGPDATSQTSAANPNPLLSPTQARLLTEVFLQGCRPATEAPSADASTPDDGASGEADAAMEAQDDGPEGGGDVASPPPPDAADGGD